MTGAVRSQVLAVTVLGVASACAESAPGPDRPYQVGDTTVVRSSQATLWPDTATLVEELRIGVVSGDEDYQFGRISALAVGPGGTIYVADIHGPTVRAFTAEGQFIRRIGRQGQGPGEYFEPDGGMTVLSDGRLVLRDPGNGRLNVYDPDGEPAGTWSIIVPRSSRPLRRDAADGVYTQVFRTQEETGGPAPLAVARVRPDGTPDDTVFIPETDFEPPMVTAGRGDERNAMIIPFTGREIWALSPQGQLAHAVTDRYAINLVVPGTDSVVRVERTGWEPVPVLPGERAVEEVAVERAMRGTQPGWSWGALRIPDQKAPIRELLIGEDGRLWVLLSQEAEPVGSETGTRWVEPYLFDVFESDGTYLGSVRGPEERFSTWAAPVLRGNQIWAMTWDEQGVQHVVRYRIQHGG